MCNKARKPVFRLARLDGSILGLQVGKAAFVYLVERIPAAYGVGFRLRKQEPHFDGRGTTFTETEAYDVNIDPAGKQHSCECLGFLRWGHCKHADNLYGLLVNGQLRAA